MYVYVCLTRYPDGLYHTHVYIDIFICVFSLSHICIYINIIIMYVYVCLTRCPYGPYHIYVYMYIIIMYIVPITYVCIYIYYHNVCICVSRALSLWALSYTCI